MIGVETLVVVVHCNRENLLSSVLPHNILVEVAVHLRREGRRREGGGQEGGEGGEREREREREKMSVHGQSNTTD